MKVIAISGWVKSGKDTAANLLINEFGFTRVGFADKLKDNVAEDYDLDRASLDDQAQKELPLLHMPVKGLDGFTKNLSTFLIREFRTKDGVRPVDSVYQDVDGVNTFMGVLPDNSREIVYWTRRALCILEGSTKRTADPDYWVKIAVKTAKRTGKNLVVISDLRYRNELSTTKMALEAGDELVTVRVNRFDDTESKDPSERDLDNAEFDVVIENRSTLEEFLTSVRDLGLFVVTDGKPVGQAQNNV